MIDYYHYAYYSWYSTFNGDYDNLCNSIIHQCWFSTDDVAIYSIVLREKLW